MRRIYLKFRILPMAFALGLSAVYCWKGSLKPGEAFVYSPESEPRGVFIVTVPVDPSRPVHKYYCEELTDEGERSSCIHQVIFEGRDMSLYDNRGLQGCGLEQMNSNAAGCERSLVSARAFVWKHWRQKKRGYLAVAGASKDAEWVTHLFIEPADNGKWRVVERTIPMILPAYRELGLDDLIEVKWRRATAQDENGFRRGTFYLELSDVVGDSLIL